MPNLWESAAVAICAVVGVQMLRTYLGKRKIRGDFDYAMQVVAKQAVKHFKAQCKVDLDFSPASIDRIEEMLGKILEDHSKKPMKEKELSAIHSLACLYPRSTEEGRAREMATRFRKGWPRYHASRFRFHARSLSLFLGIQKNRRRPG
jgi:hypothetical protein